MQIEKIKAKAIHYLSVLTCTNCHVFKCEGKGCPIAIGPVVEVTVKSHQCV